MHAGDWDKSAAGSHEVRGRRLGIVGYGNIGAQLSVLAESLGMTVLFYDTADKLALGNARRCGTLEELLEMSDVVTLHVDGRPGNSGLFGERPSSPRCGRAADLPQPVPRLRRRPRGAARSTSSPATSPVRPSTCSPPSRKAKGEEFASELRGLPNVILTPHVGGSTEEAQQDIGEFVAGKLRDYVGGRHHVAERQPARRSRCPAPPARTGWCTCTATCPVCWPPSTGCSPTTGVNIEGQLLGTRDELGYVLTDIGTEYTAGMLDQLRELDVTIRLRTTPPA